MRRTELSWVAIAAVTIVIGGCSKPPEERLASGVAVGTGGAASDAKSDGDFVPDIAIMNMAEIELSRMAVERAAGADIKAFARQLIADHDAARIKLETVVSGHSIEWPAQLDDKHKELVNELAKKQGAEFDRDYMEAIIDGHENVAARLESRLDVQSLADWKTAAAGRTQSAAMPDPKSDMRNVQIRPNDSGNELTRKINQWAAETYPVVQKHLDTARTLENATKKRLTD
jgi:predicted outer membrane protein